MPQDRKYSKSGLNFSAKPRYLLPPKHPIESVLKLKERPFKCADMLDSLLGSLVEKLKCDPPSVGPGGPT